MWRLVGPDRGITDVTVLAAPDIEACDSNTPRAGLPGIQRTSDGLALVCRRNISATDVTWTVEQSPALGAGADWQPATVSEETLTDDGATRIIRAALAEPASGRLFLRLRVTITDSGS